MTDYLTPDQDCDLRLEIARILTPKREWKHEINPRDWRQCLKCGKTCWSPVEPGSSEFRDLPEASKPCRKPSPSTEPMPVLVEKMKRLMTKPGDQRFRDIVASFRLKRAENFCPSLINAEWFAFEATPEEQAACLVAALKEHKNEMPNPVKGLELTLYPIIKEH